MQQNRPSRPPSLIEHTLHLLKQGIQQGSWVGLLPGERELSQLLQVSRPTIRAALAALEREGWLEVKQGARRSIVRSQKQGAPEAPPVIGLLSSRPLHEIIPHAQAWNERFREVLAREGYSVQNHYGRRWFTPTPERELAAFTTQSPAAAWVLFLSTAAMQQWFETSGRPSIVSGSLHQGIRLPMVDFDHRATCRHAASRFLVKGHRSMVFLRTGRPSAGDIESEQGFFEGIAAVDGASGVVVEHDGSPASIRAAVSRILRQTSTPTGVLVLRANAALVVASEMIRRRVRIPEDVSVVCRDSDHFLDYFSPAIARYEADPLIHAQRLAKLVLRIVKEGGGPVTKVRLIPKFRPGESLGSLI